MPHEQNPMADVVSGKITEVRDAEVLIERPDGSRVTVIVNIRPLKNVRGEVVGAINCFYDITERKQAEVATASLAAIVESSDDAIISKDLNGVITNWNKGAERLFGYTAQETIGQSITMLIPPERFDEEPSILGRIRRGESIEHYETVRRRKDGKLIDISLTVSPLRNAQGRVVGASKIARDITERKQVEESLRKAKDELESRVQERTYELQNQVMETEKAEDSLRDLTGRLLQVQDEERRRMARELHDSAGQTLVALSLNLAGLESGGVGPDRTASKLDESKRLVDALSKEIRTLSYLMHPPLLDEAGLDSALSWYIDGFSKRSDISVDLVVNKNFGRLSQELETAIFRLIQESLTNIHRHSGSSSAKIRITRSESQVEIEISDHGKGIPPDKLRELATAKAGVGMRGMQERVRQLGGTFKITSNGHGTCVAAVFPVSQQVACA